MRQESILPVPKEKGVEYRKTATVFALRMEADFEVKTIEGLMKGLAGDYLVQANTERAETWIVAKDVFEGTYEAI